MTAQPIGINMPLAKVEAPSTARERVLQAAEALFMEQGYAAITLRDIAEALSIRQASLYYHFPNGKEELYVAVVTAVFSRHHAGIKTAIHSPTTTFSEKLQAVAQWSLKQSSINLLGMMHADMPALSQESRDQLFEIASSSIFLPIRHTIQNAVDQQEIRPINVDLVTGSFLAILDGIRYQKAQIQSRPMSEEWSHGELPSDEKMVTEIIDILINGMRPSLLNH